MNSKTLLALAIIPTISLVGCATTLKGNGQSTSKTHSVAANITAVEVSGEGLLKLSQGDESGLLIRADSNLHDYIKVSSRGNTLYIEPKGTYQLDAKSPMVYELVLTQVNGIELSGAVDAQAVNIDTDKLSLELSGASEIALEGVTERLLMDISGAAEVNALALSAQSVELDASGAVDIAVNAQQRLDIDASGARSIAYQGQPQLSLDVSGSSSIVAR